MPGPACIRTWITSSGTLPDDQEFAPGLQAYFATSGRKENRPIVESRLSNGLQRPDGIEIDLGTAIGKLRSA